MTTKYSFHPRFLLLCLWLVANVAVGQETIPVIAYMGVPADKTSDEHYRAMRDCGFDVNIAFFGSLAQVRKALDCAERSGMKLIPKCQEILANPSEAARQLKDHPALYGYFIEDEPHAERIRQLQPFIARLKAADPAHLCYMNLHPLYTKKHYRAFKTNSYDEYVREFIKAGPQVVSFDLYPITTGGLKPLWYECMEIVRRESARAGLPFWAFALATPHWDYPQPTIAHLRLQVYSNLAYGAQAIEYFTYWTPQPHDNLDYHNGPVDTEGRKTKTYALVKQMNDELRSVGRLFCGATVTSVGHLGHLPEGTARLSVPPRNIRKIVVEGEGAIVSQFTKAGRHYAAIVNRSFERRLTVRITPANSLPRRLTKTLQAERLHSKYTLPAGDILLLQLD